MKGAHLIWFVRDQEVSTEFYARVLGCEPTLRVPGMTEFSLPGGAVLGLMPEGAVRRLHGEDVVAAGDDPPLPRAELYLIVEDAGAHHARALAQGAREVSPLRQRGWGDRAAYSLDLDGHMLAFAERP